MRRNGLLVLTTGLTALMACSPKPVDQAVDQAPPAPVVPMEERGQDIMATFTCPDSLVIYAIFRNDSLGNSEVSLAIDEERLHLPRALSADGARYTDGTTTFWNKGKEVTFDWKGQTRICTTD